jgi:casein kinase II subunit alpha
MATDRPPNPAFAGAIVHGRYDPSHLHVSRVHANVNLDLGADHWTFHNWNPPFGQISRYTLCKIVGSGRYSDVFIGLQDGARACAIKLLKPVHPDRVRREFKIISVLQGHPNVLDLWDIVLDRDTLVPALVTSAVPNMAWRKLFKSFTLSDIRFYMYRLLAALAHTHAHGVMHRDVKPLNVLCVNPREAVVLCDWGLAEFYHPLRNYSPRVCTPFYKAPELVFGYELYDYSIDIWAAGIIMLEAISGRWHVVDLHELKDIPKEITRLIGGREIIEWARKYGVALQPDTLNMLRRYPKRPFARLIKKKRKAAFQDPDAMDLIEKLMTVDHKMRISAEEALGHPFFAEVREYDAAA